MRVFDDEFNMEKYTQQRLLEIEGLGTRSILKDIVSKLFIELHGEVEREYRDLAQRVYDEAPMQTQGPAVVTNIVDKKLYDVTDRFLLPMREEDLMDRQIDPAELSDSINNHAPFFLYTVFLQADYEETCVFDYPERTFRGTVKTRHNEYTAQFHVCRNKSYRNKIEELYEIFRLNYLPWRSVCAPYLHKLFDVYIDKIENWDAKEAIEEAVIEFEEFQPLVRYHQLPLWNISLTSIKSSTYPDPCVDKTNYEHRIFRHRFQENTQYLITNADAKITNIRWINGDLLITCAEENPVLWNMYQFHPLQGHAYPNRSMDNAKKATFSDKLAGMCQQSLKTKLELNRLLASYDYELDLAFVDVRLIPNYAPKETYPVDDFIRDEIRIGGWETALQIDFQPQDRDFYLNRDIMSFLIGIIQRHFPEYECCGRLV